MTDYKGQHTAPMSDDGSPMWNVCLNGTYPKDFYSFNGAHYYTWGDIERNCYYKTVSAKNDTSYQLKVYRAVPKSLDKSKKKINTGDWVTISRAYAVQHGESALNGDYSIISKTVRARDIFTDGNSIAEWGYDPQDRKTALEAKREYLNRKG